MSSERDDLRNDWQDPLPQRLPSDAAVRAEILARHAAATAAGASVYPDPQSGLMVFSARFLADRRYCCGSGCRHCPYAEDARR